jgi:hypothetical protein
MTYALLLIPAEFWTSIGRWLGIFWCPCII